MKRAPQELSCLGRLAWELTQAREAVSPADAAHQLAQAADLFWRLMGLPAIRNLAAESDAEELAVIGACPNISRLALLLVGLAEAWHQELERQEERWAKLGDAARLVDCVPQHRITAMLEQFGQRGTCKGCGRTVWWVRHRTGAVGCWTNRGLSHFVDCPKAKDFKRTERRDAVSPDDDAGA